MIAYSVEWIADSKKRAFADFLRYTLRNSPLRHSGKGRNPDSHGEPNDLDTGFRRYDEKREGSGNF